jgi:hypothetical protein
MKAHRGPLILVLGIASIVTALFGLVICGFLGVMPVGLGITAVLLAQRDLKEMAAGLMDPSGQPGTRAGKTCGIIGLVLGGLALVLTVLALLVFGLIGGAGILDALHKK